MGEGAFPFLFAVECLCVYVTKRGHRQTEPRRAFYLSISDSAIQGFSLLLHLLLPLLLLLLLLVCCRRSAPPKFLISPLICTPEVARRM
jgi:hypothetical protein